MFPLKTRQGRGVALNDLSHHISCGFDNAIGVAARGFPVTNNGPIRGNADGKSRAFFSVQGEVPCDRLLEQGAIKTTWQGIKGILDGVAAAALVQKNLIDDLLDHTLSHPVSHRLSWR